MTTDDRPRGRVRLEGTGKRLTIYCGESDRFGRRPLATAIVERARDEGLAGATVLRGIEGFGASSHLHTTRFLSLSDDLPVVIELVDQEDRIRAFLPLVDEMLTDGMVSLEDVEISIYRAQQGKALDDDDELPR
jgi:PII-like signaling protein